MDFERLIQQPESQRDDAWEEEFLKQIVTMNVEVTDTQSQQGPDGWPYLFVRTGGKANEPFNEVVRWLATRGIGLVINPHKMLPDYIFPYGMIWNYVETGAFLQPNSGQQAPGQVYITPESKLVTGNPSENYLPPYVRGVLREFLKAQGLEQPRITVLASEDFKNIDLVFSAESLGNMTSAKQSVLAEALAWFLPMHYTLVIGPEKNLPQFFAL